MMARMRSSSAAVGARADIPSTGTRVCVWLKYVPKLMLMPCRSMLAKYSPMRDAGTGVPPSPPIAVVTPMRSLFSASPLRGRMEPD